ncbi:UbiA family prenyltransferase [Streptomyces sp. NPDC021212]|uniref:UbiA family prenyltransferase n=1 Tax=Streptomyces sp. NPDC021212 TaxID=3365118 RepID=UPI0037B632C5
MLVEDRAQFVRRVRRSLRQRAIDFASLTRWTTCVAAGVATVLGAHLASPQVESPRTTIFAAGCMAFTCAVANVVNDAVDVDVDSVNKKDRPIPSGRVSPSVALWSAVVLSTLALTLAYPLGWINFVFAVSLLSSGVAYSYLVKGRLVALSNVVVALVASSSVLFGASAVGVVGLEVSFAYLSVFLFMLSYDLLKTIIDLDGDAQAGLRTLPISIGREKSFVAFRVAAGAFIFDAIAGISVSSSPTTYEYRIFFAAIAPIVVAVILTFRRGSRSAHAAARILWISWLPGLWALGSLR